MDQCHPLHVTHFTIAFSRSSNCVCVQEFNKLRVAALTYGSPELIQFMIDLLERERSAALQHKGAALQHKGAALLARAIDFLQTSSDCAEKLSSNTAVPQ